MLVVPVLLAVLMIGPVLLELPERRLSQGQKSAMDSEQS